MIVGGWRQEVGEGRRGESLGLFHCYSILLNWILNFLSRDVWMLGRELNIELLLLAFQKVYIMPCPFDSGEGTGRMAWKMGLCRELHSKQNLLSSLTHLPTQGTFCESHLQRRRCPSEPKDLLSLKILLTL